MHQNFTHIDLVDRYLKGKLSDDERLSFEDNMRQDPLLAGEVGWQKDVYQALGENRRAALKHRLDQVPINTSPWTSWSGGKLAVAMGTAVAISAGVYYSLISTEQTKVSEVARIESQPVTYPQAYSLNDHLSKVDLQSVAVPELQSSASSVADAASTLGSNAATSSSREIVAQPDIVRPEVVSEFDDDTPTVDYDDFRAPEKRTLQGGTYQEEEVAIEASSDSKYDFHYQFYDNKLFLHGEFDGRPYQIIALNAEAGKQLFLEFESTYYRIEENREVAPLTAIEDTQLVNSLQRLSETE